MDLDLGPEIARFRAELRDWIAAEAPDGLAELADWNMAVTDLPARVTAVRNPARALSENAPGAHIIRTHR
jgi:hypothetical protein